MLIIPPEKLEKSVLENILESYISREGTDYGERELSMQEKLDQLRPKVRSGEVLIIYDEESESVTLMSKEDYKESGI